MLYSKSEIPVKLNILVLFCFISSYTGAKECSLSEIQQYLPDGHPDKEFVLPERWCVLRDIEEKGVILSKWANKDSGTEKHAG